MIYIRSFLALFLLISSIFGNYPKIFSDKGKAHPSLVAIANELVTEENPGSKGTLEAWNTFLQKHFLRKKGLDHQDIIHMKQHQQHAALLPHFRELGLIDDVEPSRKNYDIIVVFGGTPENTQRRYEKTIAVLKQIKRPKRIVYINGNRKLHPSEIRWLRNNGLREVTHQHLAAELIWKKRFRDKTDVAFEVMTISPPCPGARANTADTLGAYFKKFPGATTLFITDGPYGPYQGETVIHIAKKLGEARYLETVSSAAPADISTRALMDTVARRVYTHLQIKKK